MEAYLQVSGKQQSNKNAIWCSAYYLSTGNDMDVSRAKFLVRSNRMMANVAWFTALKMLLEDLHGNEKIASVPLKIYCPLDLLLFKMQPNNTIGSEGMYASVGNECKKMLAAMKHRISFEYLHVERYPQYVTVKLSNLILAAMTAAIFEEQTQPKIIKLHNNL